MDQPAATISAARTMAEDTQALELAVIVPTYKEAENVLTLINRLRDVLRALRFEIIVVDDNSPDGTADRVRQLAISDPRIRCLERIGRRGLSSACIEGLMATSAPCAAIIDGDLQHDERLLPKMLATLREQNLEIVVGSRYAHGGGTDQWDETRLRASQLATRISRYATRVELTDPLSGFFMIRTDVLRQLAPRLSGVGFKILLDIFASAPGPLKHAEIPYTFRSRTQGQSKLDSRVALEFLELLLDKSVGRYGIPAKFVMFGLVGSTGVIVHIAVLAFCFQILTMSFATAQILATGTAMTFNFFLNNVFTHYDRRLGGWGLLWGWMSFCAASSVGAVANVGVAVYLYQAYDTFWLASAIAGILVGVVWNYAITSIFTWQRRG